jgi:hypothetical protein
MNNIAYPNRKRKLLLSAAAVLAAVLLVSACSKKTPAAPGDSSPPPSSTGGTNQQPAPSGGQTLPSGQPAPGGHAPGGGEAKPPEPVKLGPVSFTEMYRQTVLDSAKAQGIQTVYIPKLGAPDERISQIQGMDKAFTLQYLNMELTESSQEIKPSGPVDSEKPVKLKLGEAKWVTASGKSALHLKLGGTYLALHALDKLSASDIEAIAESLEPLK